MKSYDKLKPIKFKGIIFYDRFVLQVKILYGIKIDAKI